MRIYLGIALFARGVLFVTRPGAIFELLKERSSSEWFVPMAVSHYVGMAHICGGILLALGLGTRIAAALQVPVLIGAVFFVHYGEGLLRVGQGLELAALVLCMLLVYCVFGGGKLSLDNLLQRLMLAHDAEVESSRHPAAGAGA